MTQARINKHADAFEPDYRERLLVPEVRDLVKGIVAEEVGRGLDKLQTSRGVRARISELLQLRMPVPEVQIALMEDATPGWLRKQLDQHHDHQTGHFTALWRCVNHLAQEAGIQVEGGAS